MSTSQLKADSRAAFEAWFAHEQEFMRSNGLGVTSIGRRKERAWDAWQASRAAIVVELPEPYDDGHGNLWLPQNATSGTIRAAGITVKGDSDG